MRFLVCVSVFSLLWFCRCAGGEHAGSAKAVVPGNVPERGLTLRQPRQTKQEEEDEEEEVIGGLAVIQGASDLFANLAGGNRSEVGPLAQIFNITRTVENAGNFVRTQVQAVDNFGQSVWKLFGINPPASLLGGGAGNGTGLFGLG